VSTTNEWDDADDDVAVNGPPHDDDDDVDAAVSGQKGAAPSVQPWLQTLEMKWGRMGR
jgi:hypothetical protein